MYYYNPQGLSQNSNEDLVAHFNEGWLQWAKDWKKLAIVATVTGVLSVIVCGLRIVARRSTKAGLWWDDYLIILAVATAAGMWIMDTWLSSLAAYGRNTETQQSLSSPKESNERHSTDTFDKCMLITQILWTIAIWFTKYSITAFYWRLFGTNKFNRTILVVLSVVITAWGLGTLFSTIFLQGTASGQKFGADDYEDVHARLYATIIIHVVIDFVIMVIPLRWIWNLKMSWTQKILLLFVFLVGSLTVAISILRVVKVIDETRNMAYLQSMMTFLWMIIETNVSVICACLPSLMPLSIIITRLWRRLRSKLSMKSPRRGSALIRDMVSPFDHDIDSSKSPTQASPSAASDGATLVNSPQASHKDPHEDSKSFNDSKKGKVAWHAAELGTDHSEYPELPTNFDMVYVHGRPVMRVIERQEMEQPPKRHELASPV